MPSRRETIEQALTDLSGLQDLYPNYYATLKAMLADEKGKEENERPNRRRSPRHARNQPSIRTNLCQVRQLNFESWRD